MVLSIADHPRGTALSWKMTEPPGCEAAVEEVRAPRTDRGKKEKRPRVGRSVANYRGYGVWSNDGEMRTPVAACLFLFTGRVQHAGALRRVRRALLRRRASHNALLVWRSVRTYIGLLKQGAITRDQLGVCDESRGARIYSPVGLLSGFWLWRGRR